MTVSESALVRDVDVLQQRRRVTPRDSQFVSLTSVSQVQGAFETGLSLPSFRLIFPASGLLELLQNVPDLTGCMIEILDREQHGSGARKILYDITYQNSVSGQRARGRGHNYPRYRQRRCQLAGMQRSRATEGK